MIPVVKPILRIVNLFPVFLGLLILGTVWIQGWQKVAAATPSGSVLNRLAGAALTQKG